jgi:hypothetical protein
MRREHIKSALYGALEELITDPRYFWSSFSPENCRLTEEGERAVKDLIRHFGYAIVKSREAELNERAQEITLNQLKKET